MRNISLIISLTTILLFSHLLSFTQKDKSDWKLAKLKDGIKVYTRNVEGAKFKEYKTNAEFQTSPEACVELLLDVDNYVNWMSHIKESYLVEKTSEEVFYVYTEVKVPWPFDNRDDVTRSIIKHDSITGVYSIEIYLEPEYLPEKKGIVRMYVGGGSWTFTPLENGKTEVFHQFMGDPAGSIPAWIVNMFLVDGPYKTMLGMKMELESKE